MELWTLGIASPRGAMHVAQRVEEHGWDGLEVVDSQNLSGDCYVCLAMAASVTQRIGLGPGVTNSMTRAAAVTASAIGSVQSISKGRAVLGIGRGDSALAHLGRAPARLGQFERYVRHLQAYLSGRPVPFAELTMDERDAPPVATLGLAATPIESRMDWLRQLPKVPLEVAATGPSVIGIAARHADRVLFTLGADPERIAWGIEVAREARRQAGLDPNALVCGAYINLACDTDLTRARNDVRGGLTTFARFSVMHGAASGPLSGGDRQVLQTLHDAYDMREHTSGSSPQAATLTDAFIDRFAIAGTPELCLSRLRELAGLGLDKLIISGPVSGRRDGQPTLFESTVLPALRPAA